jgi:cyanophycinase-like exopeptidase
METQRQDGMKLADHHLILSASNNAQNAALSLFSCASAIYPENNKELVSYFIMQTIEAGISLGLNARKVMELCHFEDVEISQTRWKYECDQSRRISSFLEATHAFVHARQLKVITLRSPTEIFPNDIVMTEFMVSTDRRASARLDIFGFAWTYMSKVAPKLEPQSFKN